MKALVVDDSAVMRKVLIGALTQAGITDVVQAADGKEAVEATEADAVLLRLQPPRTAVVQRDREDRSIAGWSEVATSAGGEDELPDWPDFTDMWDDIVRPILLFCGTARSSENHRNLF